jgi:hypothetical protein
MGGYASHQQQFRLALGAELLFEALGIDLKGPFKVQLADGDCRSCLVRLGVGRNRRRTEEREH